MQGTRLVWRLVRTFCLPVPLVACLFGCAFANDDTHWILPPPAVGDWFDLANWDNGVPSRWDYAYIDNGGTVSIATGEPCARYLYAGYSADGAVSQTGGTVYIRDVGYLSLGERGGARGTYTLTEGELHCPSVEYIGLRGNGVFRQTGGTNAAGSMCLAAGYVSGYPASRGEYELSGGDLTVAGTLQIGEHGTGAFQHTGGTVQADWLAVGSRTQGTYEMGPGTLLVADREFIGLHGGGTFTQTGGVNSVGIELYLSRYATAGGTYEIMGGTLAAPDVYVGTEGVGRLNIGNHEASISVSNLLRFGPQGTLVVSAGAAIHMTGAAFENHSNSEVSLEGLESLELIFEGGPTELDPFEVAGFDWGSVTEGFDLNFALGKLTLGGADVGKVLLADNSDNGNRGGPAGDAEALYVHDLVIGPASVLDLNGFHVYYDGAFINQGTILNGGPIFVPEPATLSLLAAGMAAVWMRKRRAVR